jgi:hypothetical protein
VDTHLPPFWRQHLLAVIGARAGAENLRLLDAWQRAEGGAAKWNPLNTTFELPGASDYNSAGVKSYPRPVWGVCATALTITNGNYGGIVGDLQAGAKTAEQIVNDRRAQFATWGTSADVILQLLAA